MVTGLHSFLHYSVFKWVTLIVFMYAFENVIFFLLLGDIWTVLIICDGLRKSLFILHCWFRWKRYPYDQYFCWHTRCARHWGLQYFLSYLSICCIYISHIYAFLLRKLHHGFTYWLVYWMAWIIAPIYLLRRKHIVWFFCLEKYLSYFSAINLIHDSKNTIDT